MSIHSLRHADAMCKETMRSLADVPAGKSAVVVDLRGGRVFVNRIASLGFTPGVEVQMIQNYRRGPVIVLVRGARVALGRGASLRVLVEQQSNDQEHRPGATTRPAGR